MLFLEIAIVSLLVVLNGVLAMSELAIVSSRPARLRSMAAKNVIGARRALALAESPGRFLSTVQVGITLVGVLSGAFSGATIGLRLAGWLSATGMGAGAAETVGVGVVVAAITYASLIVGELVPKQIALRNPEAVAVKVAPAMTILAKVASPVVWFLDVSGKVVLRAIGQRSVAPRKVSEEEIKTLIAEAETAGVLEPGEREMIASVMRLGDRSVRAVMTPRPEVDMIDLAADAASILASVEAGPHSRLPAFDGDPDNIVGIIHVKDLIGARAEAKLPDFRRLVRTAPVVPDTADVLDVVSLLKDSPVHIGLVHDEYGHFEGVVTTADILEAIVGAFRTSEGPAEAEIVRRPDGSLLVSGAMLVDEFAEASGIPIPETRAYHTVAGFVLDGFGMLPAVGDSFDAHGWRFEVLDLDGHRIDKILATRLPGTRRAAS